MKRNILRHWLWLIPLLGFALDAQAWGLNTHVYFAQTLLWLAPVAHPAFRAAARKFPRLLMAGACLPDLALMAPLVNTQAFDPTHEWDTAARLMRNADDDESRALALGFASHLLADIFAHNHFVPAHEEVWGDVPFATHVACEWALDHHLRDRVYGQPARLLAENEQVISPFVAAHFSCDLNKARRAVKYLARADRLLRVSGLPALMFHAGRMGDRRMVRRFQHYLSNTVRRMGQMDRLIAGELPQWHANPERHVPRAELARLPLRLVHLRLPMPADVFASVPRKPAMGQRVVARS